MPHSTHSAALAETGALLPSTHPQSPSSPQEQYGSSRDQVSLLTEAGDSCLPQSFAEHRRRGEAQPVLMLFQHQSGAPPGNISTARGRGCSQSSSLPQLMSHPQG